MSAPLELVELLRKSQRSELLPLAKTLGLKPHKMKRATLARGIDQRLRRLGAHEMSNLLSRRGEGPAYQEVLKVVGKHLGLALPEDVEEAELMITQRYVHEHWGELMEASALWRRLELDRPPSADQAITALQERYQARYGFALTAAVVTQIVPGPVGCLPVLWVMRAQPELLVPAIVEVARLRQAVRYRVTVGVVGSPSSGKDAAMAAVFGVQTGNVNPIAGSTKAVEITKLPRAAALYLVNTPGLGDVVQSVTEEAKQIIDHIDVYLYVVNAQGGVQARERDDYEACVATGRPVLAVVNKIDTLRPEDQERYLIDARAKLGAPEEDFLPVAFDPLPQLAEAPIGVEAVQRWLTSHLQRLGKDPGELPWSVTRQ